MQQNATALCHMCQALCCLAMGTTFAAGQDELHRLVKLLMWDRALLRGVDRWGRQGPRSAADMAANDDQWCTVQTIWGAGGQALLLSGNPEIHHASTLRGGGNMGSQTPPDSAPARAGRRCTMQLHAGAWR